jgi:hypothetical protein
VDGGGLKVLAIMLGEDERRGTMAGFTFLIRIDPEVEAFVNPLI